MCRRQACAPSPWMVWHGKFLTPFRSPLPQGDIPPPPSLFYYQAQNNIKRADSGLWGNEDESLLSQECRHGPLPGLVWIDAIKKEKDPVWKMISSMK